MDARMSIVVPIVNEEGSEADAEHTDDSWLISTTVSCKSSSRVSPLSDPLLLDALE